ncbi:MAG: short-chain dehydrogenase, partial [Bacteroidota bacterium]
LAITMWTLHLAGTLKNTSAIVVNPGSLLDTKMAVEAFGQVWSPAEKGADILRNLAVADNYAGMTGKYYDNDRGGFGRAHPDAYDVNKINALLKVTEQLLLK